MTLKPARTWCRMPKMTRHSAETPCSCGLNRSVSERLSTASARNPAYIHLQTLTMRRISLKNAYNGSKKRSSASLQWLEVPELRGSELRAILLRCGKSDRAFSRFLGRSAAYVTARVVPVKRLKTTTVEGLMLFLGHDQFWTAYTAVTGRKPVLHRVTADDTTTSAP